MTVLHSPIENMVVSTLSQYEIETGTEKGPLKGGYAGNVEILFKG